MNIKRNQATPEFDALSVLALYSIQNGGFSWSIEGDGKSARVIQAEKVHVPATASAAASQQMTTDMRGRYSEDIGITYSKAVRGLATVTINDALWSQISGTSQAQP